MRASLWKLLFAALLAAVPAFMLGRFSRTDPATSAPPVADAAAQTHPNRPKTAASFPAEIRQIAANRASERDDANHLAKLLEWAATDPVGAMAYARQTLTNDDLAQAMAGIVTAWAKADPDSAWKWARALGPEESHHLHTVLEELGHNDPVKAAAFASEYAAAHPMEAAAMCLTAIRGSAFGGDFAAVKAFAASVPLRNTEERGMLYNYTAGLWAPFDPAAASQWVMTLPPDVRAQALIGLGEAWGEQDPPRAADFAVKLPPGESRQTALKQAITNWIQTRPEDASAWINSFEPHADFDEAMASVATLRFLMERHVDLSLDWADNISNETLRNSTLGEIVSGWSLRDPAGALRYVRDAPGLNAETRQRLEAQIRAAP